MSYLGVLFLGPISSVLAGLDITNNRPPSTRFPHSNHRRTRRPEGFFMTSNAVISLALIIVAFTVAIPLQASTTIINGSTATVYSDGRQSDSAGYVGLFTIGTATEFIFKLPVIAP